jgi:hypothetical protein
MGAIDKLAKKLGFVRLDKYGLVHTPDDRILSTRPTVLDDGVGGKIVGWLESDLAAMELERWGAPRQAAPRKIELPKPALVVSPIPAPAPPVKVAPAPAPAPVVAAVSQPRPLPGMGPVVVAAPPAPAPKVAPEPVVEEDEWEWEIAVARARAEAQPVSAPAAAPERVAARANTDTIEESWDPPVSSFGRAPRITQQPVMSATPAKTAPIGVPKFTSTPGTVIPVPALPAAADPRAVRPAIVASSLPKRFPRATGKVEDTIRTHAAPPANDDKTSPSIALPPAASTIGLPSTKRVAAKQR